MLQLDESDVRALTEAIHESRDTPTLDDFPRVSIEATARVVRLDTISWNEVDPLEQRLVALMHPFVELTERHTSRFGELTHEHPVLVHIGETGDGSPRRISDFISSEELHRRRIYREIYAELGVEHQIAMTLPAPLPRIVGIALNRSELGDDFDERDRFLLSLLRPHLAQSYEHARERTRMQQLIATMADALTEDDTFVVVLDTVPTDATPGALVHLYRYFGRPGNREPFPARIMRWLEVQRRAAHQPAGTLPDALRPIAAERDGRQLVVRYLPAAGSAHEALLLNTRTRPTTAAELRRLGLTPREAEILELLATGATNAELGARLHIAPGTVKKHLDNLYRKLGVRGRVQAVAMAMTLLPGRTSGHTPHP